AFAGQWDRSTLRQSGAQVMVPPGHVCPATSSPSQTSPHSASMTPLPHSISPSPLHPSQSAVLPSSHSSPQSTTPLPTTSRVQRAEQPSQSVVFPSSPCSPAATTPSPHRGDWPGSVVVVLHGPDVNAAQALQTRKDPPGDVQATSPSHTSPGSTTPLPQCAGAGRVVLVVVVDDVLGAPSGSETMLRRTRMLAATSRPSTSLLLPRRMPANGAQICPPSRPWREKPTRVPATNTRTCSVETPARGSGRSCAAVLAERLSATKTSDGPVNSMRARRD